MVPLKVPFAAEALVPTMAGIAATAVVVVKRKLSSRLLPPFVVAPVNVTRRYTVAALSSAAVLPPTVIRPYDVGIDETV